MRRTALSELLQPFAARLRGVDPKRALLSLLSSESYIGDVEIGEKAKGFQPKASREGFTDSASLKDLQSLIRFAIDWSTIYREYTRSRQAKEDADRAREELAATFAEPVDPKEVVAAAVKVLKAEVQDLAKQLPTTERQEVLRTLLTATDAIENHDASSREELRHLQLVASTSTLLLIFAHEVKMLISWLDQVSIALDQLRRKLPSQQADRIGEIRDEFAGNKKRFVELLEMTALVGVDSRDAKPTELALLPKLERAVRCFDLVRNSYHINIDVTLVSNKLKVGPMVEAELFAVLLNLLSNSVKSVIAASGKKLISVSADRKGAKTIIHFRDTGIGLDEKHYEEVFAPFVADPDNRLYRGLKTKLNPEDEFLVGTGSGLGLGIVREILSYRCGTVRFVTPTEGWKADVEIIMP